VHSATLQFFHEVAQNESWMLDDLQNAAVLLDRANIKRNMQGYDANRMLFEVKVYKRNFTDLVLMSFCLSFYTYSV
jgi:hypothetical protein